MALKTRGIKKEAAQSEWRARRFSSGPKGSVCRHGYVRKALVASDAAAGIFSWQNDNPFDVLVTRLVINATTAATGACTVDAGTAATEIKNDTLIDGLDVGTAAIIGDNVDNQGTNGNSKVSVGSDEYVTISMATGAAAGLAGYALLEWVEA